MEKFVTHYEDIEFKMGVNMAKPKLKDRLSQFKEWFLNLIAD